MPPIRYDVVALPSATVDGRSPAPNVVLPVTSAFPICMILCVAQRVLLGVLVQDFRQWRNFQKPTPP